MVTAVASTLDGIEEEDIGETSCTAGEDDSSARRRGLRSLAAAPTKAAGAARALLDASSGTEVTIDFEVTAPSTSFSDASEFSSATSDSLATALSSGALGSAMSAAAAETASDAFSVVVLRGVDVHVAPTLAPTLVPTSVPLAADTMREEPNDAAESSSVDAILPMAIALVSERVGGGCVCGIAALSRRTPLHRCTLWGARRSAGRSCEIDVDCDASRFGRFAPCASALAASVSVSYAGRVGASVGAGGAPTAGPSRPFCRPSRLSCLRRRRRPW